MKKHYLFIFLLIPLISSSVYGQARKKKNSHLIVDIYLENGNIMPNNADLKDHLLQNFYGAGGFRIAKQTDNSSFWNQLYRFPTWGFGAYGADLHHLSVKTDKGESYNQGYPNAIFGFMKIPVVKNEKWQVNYQLGFGLSYNFKPYNRETNPLNTVIGSRQNVYLDFGVNLDYIAWRKINLGIGINYKHFSNGSYRLPNTGINLIALQANLSYKFQTESFDYSKVAVPNVEGKNEIQVYWASGSKMLNEDFDAGIERHWYKGTLGGTYHRKLNLKRKLGGGVDLFYNQYGNLLAKQNSGADVFKSSFSNTINVAIYGSQELTYSRLSLVFQVGIYIYDKVVAADSGVYYLRAGLRYTIWDEVFAGVAIKAHGGKADVVEYTIGYRLPSW